MEYSVETAEDTTSIRLSGQFTFFDTQKFNDIMELLAQEAVKKIILDFSGVTFVDSACMGMLLLLRDECKLRKVSLHLSAVHGQVEKVFLISKFDQLFSIENNA